VEGNETMTYRDPDDIGDFLGRLAAEQIAREEYEQERERVYRLAAERDRRIKGNG